jgi:hypothetical protein
MEKGDSVNKSRFLKTASQINLNREIAGEVYDRIYEDNDLQESINGLQSHFYRHLNKSLTAYNKLLLRCFPEEKHPLINLYLFTSFTDKAWAHYQTKGIPRTVFIETMSDIGIWADRYLKNTGKTGLKEISWIRKHLKGEIFRLGRLQYEPRRLGKRIHGYSRRTPCLWIHIPEGEKLDPRKCRDSIEAARCFFPAYFQKDYPLACCHSWLLHNSLRVILDEDSNIVRFADLFMIVDNDDDNSQALQRVFGWGAAVSPDLPEETSLQRKMKGALLQGTEFGMGLGIIKISP